MSWTSSGFTYGLFLGLLFLGLGEWVPQPAGSIVLWTALSIQTAFVLRITWRRLRLPWFLVGTIAALLVCPAMIPISSRGLNLITIATELPLLVVVAMWLGVLFVPLSLGLESARNSTEWQAWSSRAERASLLDVITLRHVPDMRPPKSQT